MKLPLPTKAWLWDGKMQLSGQLLVKNNWLNFNLDEFRCSHLNLIIPLYEIENIEGIYLVDIKKNGLLINSKSHRKDLFVLEYPGEVKLYLEALMRFIHS